MEQKRQEIVKKKKKKEKRKGAWVARLKLQPGRYLYKFVVDGNWLVNHDLQVSEVRDDEGQEYNQIDVAPQERKSEQKDEWTEYYEKYSEWYSQYSKQYENPLEANSGPREEVKQLSFEELVQQVFWPSNLFLYSTVCLRIVSWTTTSRLVLPTSTTHKGTHSRVPSGERGCTG